MERVVSFSSQSSLKRITHRQDHKLQWDLRGGLRLLFVPLLQPALLHPAPGFAFGIAYLPTPSNAQFFLSVRQSFLSPSQHVPVS